ncbi:MAG: hypothetical protein HEQ38_19165 [Gemmatimonas sp.]|nr:hypothetical protein [Gemmatimonas sp.]
MDNKLFDVFLDEGTKELAKGVIKHGGGALVTQVNKRYPHIFSKIREMFAGASLETAERRVDEFDPVLSDACGRQAQQARVRGASVIDPVEALDDPDKFHAFRSSINSVTRTSSAERRKMLADALAMRLQLDTESERAIISNIAIETMPVLSPQHLEILGLLAVIYALHPQRPSDFEAIKNEYYQTLVLNHPQGKAAPVDEEVKGRLNELNTRLEEIEAQFSLELATSLFLYNIDGLTSSVVAHLSSVGCVERERIKSRSLWTILETGLGLHRQDKRIWALSNAWEHTLQHLTLTPLGLLIGILVHDQRAHTNFLEKWEWEGITLRVASVDDWRKDPRSPEFEALMKTMASEARRTALSRGRVI